MRQPAEPAAAAAEPPPPPVNCDDLDMREDLYNYNDEGLTEPLTCENVRPPAARAPRRAPPARRAAADPRSATPLPPQIYAHPSGREKGCNAFYESMPGIGTNWGAREYIFCTLADDGSCKSSAPARCHMPKSVGAAAATAASCPQLAEAYNSRCSATAGYSHALEATGCPEIAPCAPCARCPAAPDCEAHGGMCPSCPPCERCDADAEGAAAPCARSPLELAPHGEGGPSPCVDRAAARRAHPAPPRPAAQ